MSLTDIDASLMSVRDITFLALATHSFGIQRRKSMHVFVTGGSGWIGSPVVDDLMAMGHVVTGLARSESSAAVFAAKGVHVLRGDLDDLGSLRTGAEAAEAVIHLANKHDWSNPAVSSAAERAAVQTIGETLIGSNRPFLLASGMVPGGSGRVGTEADGSPFHGMHSPRGGSENLAMEFVDREVHTVAVRFAPTVHGMGDYGLIAMIAAIARVKGVSGYPGDGTNRWPAVHRNDASRVVVLSLENVPAGTRLHAVAEEGVPTKAIAEAIGRAFALPVTSIAPDDVADHYGWIGTLFGMDLSASSVATQELLGWTPTGPTLIEDIDAGAYASS
jgi:nucleoside-diphosphate-sugar epimerase